MSTAPEQPKRRGRPQISADKRLTERAEIRMTASERAKFAALGGAEWLRKQLARVELPS